MVGRTSPRPGRGTARNRLLPLLALLLVVAAGCAGADEPTEDPWRPEVLASLDRAQTPFGRDAMRDGLITADEYAAASQRVADCAQLHSAPLVLEDRYGLTIFSSADHNYAEVLDRCETGDLGTVRSLYEARYQDPNREGDVVVLRCLRAAGLITDDQLETAEPLGDLLDRLMTDDAPEAQLGLVDRCLYDPAGRSWR
ncbi:hypothetical protein O7627_10985 [Solwaraspora sp. WMMD1047]|uniref:hypothetical protein n=1 Tax=Solwaraspora sp. WMMD1047 TaxID=3016102 RepID=UPI002415FBF0|nr:hypothetical protein [Solwaraspora sp. WMMD1047]MDG4829824.1 hypothetical protein [Solwaraspora sp. WMMD1047]